MEMFVDEKSIPVQNLPLNAVISRILVQARQNDE
jgi:hypothetical protein